MRREVHYTEYTCDVCGNTDLQEKDLWTITIDNVCLDNVCQSTLEGLASREITLPFCKDVCSECLKDSGIVEAIGK